MNRRTALALLAATDVALFLLSGIPSLKDAHHGLALVISDVVWFGFLLGLLTLVVTGVVAVVARTRRARAGH